MAKQRKKSGRVTPKGTVDPATKRSAAKGPGKPPVTHQRDLPGRVRQPKGFGGRPISHHRGNR